MIHLPGMPFPAGIVRPVERAEQGPKVPLVSNRQVSSTSKKNWSRPVISTMRRTAVEGLRLRHTAIPEIGVVSSNSKK
jgi:hypothetical protein